MSRGDRAAVIGNLSSSMRDNYDEHGVVEYYKKVGSTYRNPHYPGVRLCIFAWLSKWWSNVSSSVTAEDVPSVLLFDMACGDPLSRDHRTYVVPLGSGFPVPLVVAADPFTSVAYKDRTSFPCAALSFHDIAQGELPPFVSDLSNVRVQPPDAIQRQERDVSTYHGNSVIPQEVSYTAVEMVICSFALHLIPDPSALFTLLCTLSYKARWLIVLAPHKKPEIKDGWGWEKWNTEEWKATSMSSHDGEILFDRVHCRVYRSVSF